jgi:hypothetical protein
MEIGFEMYLLAGLLAVMVLAAFDRIVIIERSGFKQRDGVTHGELESCQ